MKNKEIENEKFSALMQKLLAGVPLDVEDDGVEINAKDLQDSVTAITKRI